MFYESFTYERFFSEVTTEEDARRLIWHARFHGKDFVCPHCQNEGFNAIKTRPEVRTCKACRKQTRLRSGTLFESSKTPLLIWVKSIFHVMSSKRGISALELQRHLGLKSYGLTWTMLQKIREALKQRDEQYQVGDGVIEIDGAVFGKRASNNQAEALIAIETKSWIDEKGREKKLCWFCQSINGKRN